MIGKQFRIAVVRPNRWLGRMLILMPFFLVVGNQVQAKIWSDSFGSGKDRFDIEFVTIGNPGNPADVNEFPRPLGTVDYVYGIGTNEISRAMIDTANRTSNLGIVLDSMSDITGGPRDAMPATGMSWYEAATFVNWLNSNSGQPLAYKFQDGSFELWKLGDAGFDPQNPYRNRQARYFLPDGDEWYKAAYFNPKLQSYSIYPTGSNSVPDGVDQGTAIGMAVYLQTGEQGPADVHLAGGLSPYGTRGQGGNVFEWQETEFDFVNDLSSDMRAFRGGYWAGTSMFLKSDNFAGQDASIGASFAGFRVAAANNDDQSLTQDELDANRDLWELHDVDSYDFVLQRICHCLEDARRPGRVKVRGGVITAVFDPETNRLLNPNRYLTVDSLFNELQDAIHRPADGIRTQFDPTFGFPWNLNIDFDWGIADEELIYVARDFELLGDFNENNILDVGDIDALTTVVASNSNDLRFDVDDSGDIDGQDRFYWVKDLRGTWLGDANLDGAFDSSDLIAVFQQGEYEDDFSLNSSWASGDWDGDGDFSSSDIVAAFKDGGYERGEAPATATVPEPSTLSLLLITALFWLPTRASRSG